MYPRVSSKRFTFTTGYASWVTLESRLHNTRAHDQSLPVSFSRASISSYFYCSFILHIFFSARFLSSLDLNPPSDFPIIKLIKICSILMVEETGVPGGNHRYVIRAENPFYMVQLI
jgi:hypothetical protein